MYTLSFSFSFFFWLLALNMTFLGSFLLLNKILPVTTTKTVPLTQKNISSLWKFNDSHFANNVSDILSVTLNVEYPHLLHF